jgi:hypothetical protein
MSNDEVKLKVREHMAALEKLSVDRGEPCIVCYAMRVDDEEGTADLGSMVAGRRKQLLQLVDKLIEQILEAPSVEEVMQ